jgi:ribosome production factor 2
MALKRPNAISFSKKNLVRPFEDASSLEFWAQKNDTSLFVLGQSTKKRPDGLVFARTFDGRVLDICEVGVERFVSMDKFKVYIAHRIYCFFLLTNNVIALDRHRNRHRGINR